MDPYVILNINRNTPQNEIDKIYKKLAFKYHPDRHKENKKFNEEKFKEVSWAYNTLLKRKNNLNNFNSFNFDSFNFGGFKFDASKFDSYKFDNVNDFENIKNNILNKGNFLRKILNNLKNLEYDNIFTNLIKEINNLSDYYEEKGNLKKGEDFVINANIDLIDIYNNMEKKIEITRLRKCKTCFSLGIIISKNKTQICDNCKGNKYVNTDIELTFNSKNKTVLFSKMNHHMLGYISGDIILNLIPKKNNNFSIYNYYDIIYFHKIDKNDILNNHLIIEILYLDNIKYKFKITNPIINYQYVIENMGLQYIDCDKKGNLIIVLIFKNQNNSNSFINRLNI